LIRLIYRIGFVKPLFRSPSIIFRYGKPDLPVGVHHMVHAVGMNRKVHTFDRLGNENYITDSRKNP
jgi:hypothetical protein